MTAPYLPLAADVMVRNRDLSGAPGLPLVAIARNESALLPAFLAHYRTLGVRRFFILDDASDDGSPDLLAAQSELLSAKRFNNVDALRIAKDKLRLWGFPPSRIDEIEASTSSIERIVFLHDGTPHSDRTLAWGPSPLIICSGLFRM